jgi:hypothetical protein
LYFYNEKISNKFDFNIFPSKETKISGHVGFIKFLLGNIIKGGVYCRENYRGSFLLVYSKKISAN